MHHRSYILRDPVDTDEVFLELGKLVHEVNRVTRKGFSYSHPETRGPMQLWYWPDHFEQQSVISLVLDSMTQTTYLQVDAVSASEGEQIVAELGKGLDFLSPDEVREEVSGNNPPTGAGLSRLGMVTNPEDYDARTKDILASALEHDDPQVRNGACAAIFLLKWPQFVPALEDALAKETVVQIRRVLDATLQLCNGTLRI